jgi:O-antigen/teichoic acid export membrane protein
MSSQGDIAAVYPRQSLLLRLVEKYSTPTIRKSVLAIAGQGMVSCANFLTILIIGRLCGKEELGLYSLGFTVIVFASELQMSLISTPYMVFSPQLQGEARARYAGSSLIHQLMFTVGAMLAAGAVAGFVGAFGDTPGLGPVLGVVALMIGFLILREFVRRICFAGLKMTSAFIFDASVSAFQVSSLAVLYLLGLLSARNAYLSLGAVCAVISMIWLIRNWRAFSVRFSDVLADLKRNWAFSKWVAASGLLWSVSMNFYPWLITLFHDKSATGAFAACMGVANFGAMILIGAQNFLGPKIANVYAEEGLSRMQWFVVRASVAFLAPMAPFCLLLWIFGDRIIQLLYGSGFAGNGAVVSVLSLNLLALSLAFSFSRALFAIERADVDFYVNFFALLTLLAAGIWLVWAYGPMGAALGLLIANVAASSVRCVAFMRIARSNNRRKTE